MHISGQPRGRITGDEIYGGAGADGDEVFTGDDDYVNVADNSTRTDTVVFDLGIDDVDDGDTCEDLDPVTEP